MMTRATSFKIALVFLLLGASAIFADQGAVTVFRGVPKIRVNEQGVSRQSQSIPRTTATNFAVVISQIGDQFYWASRENTLLVRVDGGGAYVTFVAANGSGYIRVIKPESKSAAALLDGAGATYDYVEHLLLGLTSVTYYGGLCLIRLVDTLSTAGQAP